MANPVPVIDIVSAASVVPLEGVSEVITGGANDVVGPAVMSLD
jgi:hypothetical protein